MRKFFDINRQKNMGDGDILRLMLPSLLSLVLCIVCLAGTSWAWFSDTVTGSGSLTAANFSCTITVQEKESSTEIPKLVDPNATAAFKLERNKAYLVTITADDTDTTASKGYCLIYFSDAEGNNYIYRTKEINKGGTFVFTYENGAPEGVEPDQDEDTLILVAHWGMYTGSDIQEINNNDTIGTPIQPSSGEAGLTSEPTPEPVLEPTPEPTPEPMVEPTPEPICLLWIR